MNATDLQTITFSISDTTNFSINSTSGVIRNATLLQIGDHPLTVSATDTFGNINSTLIFVRVRDTIAPSWSQFPVNQTIEFGIPFVYDLNATDLQTITFGISDTTNFSINSSSGLIRNATLLQVRNHQLTVNASDPSGNINSTLIFVRVVDTINPSLSIQSPQNITYNSPSIYLNYTATDSGSGVSNCSYKLDSGSITQISSCQNITLFNISDGSHNVIVYVNDTSNNINSSNVSFTIDTIAPTINIQRPQNITYNISTIDLNYTATDSVSGVSSCSYKLDSGSITQISGCQNTTVYNVSDGLHIVILYANDSVGNTNSSNVSFTIDTHAPTWTQFPTIRQLN